MEDAHIFEHSTVILAVRVEKEPPKINRPFQIIDPLHLCSEDLFQIILGKFSIRSQFSCGEQAKNVPILAGNYRGNICHHRCIYHGGFYGSEH